MESTKKFKLMMVLLVFLFAAAALDSYGQCGYISIKVNYEQAKPTDTLMLKLPSVYIGKRTLGKATIYPAKNDGKGNFIFKVPVTNQYGYFEITVDRRIKKSPVFAMPLLNAQFWETGDNISIKISHDGVFAGNYSKCEFSGTGSEKYIARYQVEKLSLQNEGSFDGNILKSDYYIKLNTQDSLILKKIDEFKLHMSRLSYNVLKADIIFEERANRFYFVRNFYSKITSDNLKEKFKEKFHEIFDKEISFSIPKYALVESNSYFHFVYKKSKCEQFLLDEDDNNMVFWNIVNQRYTGSIRDALIIMFLSTNRLPTHSADLFKESETIVKTPKYRLILEVLGFVANNRFLGNYSLKDINDKEVKLSDYTGKIILLDFWNTGCGYCSLLYQNVLSKVEHDLQADPSIVFLSISVDKSRYTWEKSVASNLYCGKESVNLYTGGFGMQHPIITENDIETMGFPFLILLDKNRKVRYFRSQNLYQYDTLMKAIAEVKDNP